MVLRVQGLCWKAFLRDHACEKSSEKNPHPLETPIYGMGTIATCSVVRLQGCHDRAVEHH